jgi:hypothetical protein
MRRSAATFAVLLLAGCPSFPSGTASFACETASDCTEGRCIEGWCIVPERPIARPFITPDAAIEPNADAGLAQNPDASVNVTDPDANIVTPPSTLPVVQYFVTSGDTFVDDAMTPPLPLTILRHSGDPVYNNGYLRWYDTNRDGRACTDVAGTKLTGALDGSREATFELKARISNTSQTARLLDISDDQGGPVLRITADEDMAPLSLRAGGQEHKQNVDFDVSRVIHLVVDVDAADPADSIRFYVDGNRLTNTPHTVHLDPLDLSTATTLCLGNSFEGGRSFEGRIHYAAIYSVALSESTIAAHASSLAQDDDTL